MRIAVGSDHRGVTLKTAVISLLEAKGHEVKDFGTGSTEPTDYPDVAGEVALAVAGGKFDYGILICGTGIGMCIAANKVRGIRAAHCHDTFTARRARQHNNANVLCLGGEQDAERMPDIVTTFLDTEFEGGRHQRRLDKIHSLEQA